MVPPPSVAAEICRREGAQGFLNNTGKGIVAKLSEASDHWHKKAFTQPMKVVCTFKQRVKRFTALAQKH